LVLQLLTGFVMGIHITLVQLEESKMYP
jgi:hypothetical protein